MTDTEVLTPAKEEIKTDVAETLEVAAAIENKYGSKEKGRALTEKSKKEKEKKAETVTGTTVGKDAPANNEGITGLIDETGKTITTDTTTNTVVVEDKNKKAEDKKDNFFDPFAKPAKKEISTDGKIKEEPLKEEPKPFDLEKEQRFEEYKNKAVIYDKLKDNLVFQTLLTAAENGKDPIDAVMELAPVNYGAIGTTDTEKAQIDSWRAREYYSKVDGLKGEELDNAVKEFEEMDESNSKRRERNEHIRTLTSAQEKRFVDYKENTQLASKKSNENITNFNKEVDQFLDSIKEKKQLWGMQLTDAHLQSLEAGTKGFFKNLFDKDGKINTSLIFSAVFFDAVQKDKNKKIAETSESKGREEVLETVHLVDANENSLNNAKPQATEKTMESTIDEKFGGKQT